MDWQEFIASLVDSLAWPAAAVVIALLFRRQIIRLLELPMKRWRAGPVEVEYGEVVAEIAEGMASEETAPTIDVDPELENALQLAEKAPAVAIGKTYGLVERRLREIATKNNLDESAKLPMGRLAIDLRDRGLVQAESESAIRGLVALRNLAVHGPEGHDVTAQRAREYVVLAQGVLYGLSRRPPGNSSAAWTPA